MGSGNEIEQKSADYLAQTLKKPAGLAKMMFSVFGAMQKAGFTEKQAMEITQWLTAIAIGLGGMTN